MNKKENELFGQIRSILNGRPGQVAWIQIVSALRLWRDPETFEQVALPYVAAYTDRWPEEIPRPVTTESLQFPAKRIPVKELFAMAPGAPMLRICNTLRIHRAKMGALDMGHRILDSPHAGRIRSLELVGTDMDTRHLPPLFSLPNLRRVVAVQSSFQNRGKMAMYAEEYKVLGSGVEHLVTDSRTLSHGILGGDRVDQLGRISPKTTVFPDLQKLTTMGPLSLLMDPRDAPLTWNKIRSYEYEMFGPDTTEYGNVLQGMGWSFDFIKRLPMLSELVLPHPGNHRTFDSRMWRDGVVAGAHATEGRVLDRVVFRRRTIPEGAHYLSNDAQMDIERLREWDPHILNLLDWPGARTVEFWSGRQSELFECFSRLRFPWREVRTLVLRLRGDAQVNENNLELMAQAFENRHNFVNLNDLEIYWDHPRERAKEYLDRFESVLAARHVHVKYGPRDRPGFDSANDVVDTLVL